jgi:hypothetical protein
MSEKISADRYKTLYKDQSSELTNTQQKLVDLQNDYS